MRISLYPRALRAAALAGATLLALPGFAADEPLRIGAFLSVTGPAAFLGDPEQKTLEMVVERINAAGGIAGRKL
ncbi:MAG: ABC transporter substrate-binding protein, partial [Caldimonas sp.]